MEMMGDEVTGMSEEQLLDAAGELAVVRNRCELQMLRVAMEYAYVCDGDRLDPEEASRPGRERSRRLGGSGTPRVSEFAAAALGARLGLSAISAARLMADALDIAHRLPGLWARVQAGKVRVHHARLVARKTRDLTEDQATYVDSRVAEYADGRLSWTRFERLVEGAVAAADVEATAAREEQAARAQFARPTRPDPDTQGTQSDHGIRGFLIRAPFGTVRILDATLDRIAAILADLGDTTTLDQRRVTALLILCRPDVAAELYRAYAAWSDRTSQPGPKPEIDWSRLLPAVQVLVHVYAGPDTDGVARVERAGALTEQWIGRHLAQAARVTVTPVLDIEGQAPVDAYEIPERHRQAVHLMTPADTFPHASGLDPDQIDHTIAYRHGEEARGAGQSRIGNYGPMRLFHHRIKTHGRWTVVQPFPGVYLWRDPFGILYLVDHTGTRQLARSDAA
jgi:hypothetical protein